MIVIVKNLLNDSEEAFSGREEQVEDQLRQAYPELARTVSIGDLDQFLFRLSASYGLLLEVPEGHVAKPELHLPVRFDREPHECGPACQGLFKAEEEDFAAIANSWVLEKAIADIAPGEHVGEKYMPGFSLSRTADNEMSKVNDFIKVQHYDYSHVLPENHRHKYRIELHEHERGSNGKSGQIKLE